MTSSLNACLRACGEGHHFRKSSVDSVDSVDKASQSPILRGFSCPHYESTKCGQVWTKERARLAPAGKDDDDSLRLRVLGALEARLIRAGGRKIAPAPDRSPCTQHTVSIVGPAGTGKTSLLAKLAEDLQSIGIPSSRIRFTTFSRSAAAAFNEKSTGIAGCTVYSLAAQFLEKEERPAFLSREHRKALRKLGIPVRIDAGAHGPNERCSVSLAFDLLRHSTLTATQVLERLPNLRLSARELRDHFQTYLIFLEQHGVTDHAAFLETVIEKGGPWRGAGGIFLLDEAQDFTALEWRSFDVMSSSADLRILVGDPAQAIHGWRGGRVQDFAHRVDEAASVGLAWQLTESRRNSAPIVRYAQPILDRMTRLPRRAPVQAKTAEGRVERVPRLADISEYIASTPGTWLVLARNHRDLPHAAETLDLKGIPFGTHGGVCLGLPEPGELPFEKCEWVLWQALSDMAFFARRGELTQLGADQFRRSLRKEAFLGKRRPLMGFDPALLLPEARADLERGLGSHWLRGISKQRGERINAWVRSQGLEVLEAPQPRVLLMTLHASKGLDADRVVILNRWSKRSWRGIDDREGDEHCLAYVGVTRARSEVLLVEERGGRRYPFPPCSIPQVGVEVSR